MKHIISGIAILAGVLVVLGAWSAEFVEYAFKIGLALFLIGMGLGIAKIKEAGVIIGLGFLMMVEQPLVNALQTEIQIASAAILLGLVVWAVIRLRRRRPQTQQNRQQPPPPDRHTGRPQARRPAH